MNDIGIQGWQIPFFVTGAIVLVEGIVHLVLRARGKDQVTSADALSSKRIRTIGLALLSGLALIMAVAALGPALADQLAGVTGAALAAVGVWLAWRSYQETIKLAADIRATRGDEDAAGAGSPSVTVTAADPPDA